VLKPIFVVAACIFALMLVIKDGKVRTLACESLAAMGPAAKEVVPQLREMLAQDGSMKGPVTAALKKIEAPAVDVP